MADERDDTERSEDPTQKRLEEALKRGDVVKSQEVNTWFVIGGATLALSTFSGSMATDLATTFRGLVANAHAVSIDQGGLMRLVDKLGTEVFAAVAVPILLLVVAAIAGNVIQPIVA